MSGRQLSWGLLPLLLFALIWQGQRARERWEASRLLNAVESVTLQLATQQRADGRLFQYHVEALRRVAPYAPVEVGIPAARGGQFLLLGRPRAAIRAYREALELEPRAEIYVNLGRALRQAGELEEAQQCFHKALILDHNLADSLNEVLPVNPTVP